jgi:3-dehydroquinate dehydratase-2
MKRILLLQGQNLSRLGQHSLGIYGTTTAAELDAILIQHAAETNYDLRIVYVDEEKEAVAHVEAAPSAEIDAIVINPGGFTGTATELACAIRSLSIPFVEVHITNLERRNLRSVSASAATGVIMGLGVQSYILGLTAALYLAEAHGR